VSDEARSKCGDPADGLYNELEVEVLMQSGPRLREERLGKSHRSLTIPSRDDAELAAVALLCLLFAWPGEEVDPPQRRPVSDQWEPPE
jgi:hypothetical protein